MNKTEVQLFDNEYKTRCDTFSCGESAESMVGRPDAPLSTAMNLCAACTEQLVRSIVEKYNLHEKTVHSNKPSNYEGNKIVEALNKIGSFDDGTYKPKLEGSVHVADDVPAGMLQDLVFTDSKEELLRLADEDIKRQELEATETGLDHDEEDEPEVTLEEILEGVRSHAELDEIAKQLGVKRLPTRDEKKLNERKEYILNYEFPEAK